MLKYIDFFYKFFINNILVLVFSPILPSLLYKRVKYIHKREIIVNQSEKIQKLFQKKLIFFKIVVGCIGNIYKILGIFGKKNIWNFLWIYLKCDCWILNNFLLKFFFNEILFTHSEMNFGIFLEIWVNQQIFIWFLFFKIWIKSIFCKLKLSFFFNSKKYRWEFLW